MLYGSSFSIFHTMLALFLRRKSLVLLTVVLATLTAGLMSFFRPVEHRAQATLILKFGREYDYRPEVGDQNRLIPFNIEEAVNGEVQILNSRDLKEYIIEQIGIEKAAPWVWRRSLPAQVIDWGLSMENKLNALGLNKIIQLFRSSRYRLTEDKMSPMEKAVKYLNNNISIKTSTKSPVIQIFFDHWDKDLAVEVLNTLVEGFLQKRMSIFSAKQSSFFDKTIDEYHKKLADGSILLSDFKTKHGIVNIDEQSSLLVRHRLDLETSMQELDQRIRELKQQIAVISQGPAPSLAKVPIYSNEETAQIRSASDTLLGLKIQEQQKLSKYLEGSRPIADVRSQMAIVNRFLEDQRQVGIGRLQLEKQAAESRRQNLAQELQNLGAELERLDGLRSPLRDLERTVQRFERDYQTYADKMDVERISRALDEERVSNVRVVQAPISLPEPIGLPMGMKMVIGALFGFAAGLALAFVSELRRSRLVTPERTEEVLGLPVLAAIPDMRPSRR